MITINGMSAREWAMKENAENPYWEYIGGGCVMIVGQNPVGGVGKCIYRGKTFEGAIENIDGHLYVGGELVK